MVLLCFLYLARGRSASTVFRAACVVFPHLLFLEQSRHESCGVNRDLLGQLIESLLDLVLALDSFLLHLLFDLLQLFLLLRFQLGLLLCIFVFGCASNLQFELLLDFLVRLVLGLGVLFLELSDLVFLLFLELFEFSF